MSNKISVVLYGAQISNPTQVLKDGISLIWQIYLAEIHFADIIFPPIISPIKFSADPRIKIFSRNWQNKRPEKWT